MTHSGPRHSPVLRRAVIRAQPDFYSWPEVEQLAYRMHMPARERFVLERSVFHDLYGLDCPSETALQNAWNDLPINELNAINETLLPWKGIGEDGFYLNECLSDEDRLRFATLDEYARDDHVFQESARQKENPDHVVTPYRGHLIGRWARLFIDGRLRYATLTSLAGHLSHHISDQGQELVAALIPHSYRRGPDDGKREGDSYVWDMRRDAGGLEPQLDELCTRLYRYESRRWQELLDEFDRQAAGAVFINEIRYEGEVDENVYFIFSDKTAMAKVRFECFLRECRALERPASEIKPLEARESALLDEFLRTQHRDIVDNFNPKVAKLKKKRRVLVHKDAFR